MVKSSVALLCKSTSALKRRKIYETSEKCLKQITHLYLNGKNLDELGHEIALCQCLTVLYLYDNKLNSIPEYLNLTQLTHLYLQNNRISRMENLNSLENFLSRNCISIIEGLEGLIRLQELRIDNQNLNPGESLVFDDRSLNSVANSLICLDVSGNKLDTLQDLSNLHALISLNVSNNSIRSIHDLSTSLNKWSNLKEFHIKGNPVMKTTRARDIIIVTAKRLGKLFSMDTTFNHINAFSLIFVLCEFHLNLKMVFVK
ncbi:unnamed protein product [Schistosoma mattheei]|uniref:Uncharacterized protein n=1 Tax=Schistosoma mattheei TaxID=31246 RepID=A0A183NIE1_9TREM|nr:unnamed protein product [Schistosoma mattheei]